MHAYSSVFDPMTDRVEVSVYSSVVARWTLITNNCTPAANNGAAFRNNGTVYILQHNKEILWKSSSCVSYVVFTWQTDRRAGRFFCISFHRALTSSVAVNDSYIIGCHSSTVRRRTNVCVQLVSKWRVVESAVDIIRSTPIACEAYTQPTYFMGYTSLGSTTTTGHFTRLHALHRTVLWSWVVPTLRIWDESISINVNR
jgi:hypothetical protein